MSQKTTHGEARGRDIHDGSLVFPGVQNCGNINKLCLHVHVLKC
jgi:hypothetical protein